MPPSKLDWERAIQSIAVHESAVAFTSHALIRMREREISRVLIFDALRRGRINREPESDMNNGDAVCLMERVVSGMHLGVVVGIKEIDAKYLLVITSFEIRKY